MPRPPAFVGRLAQNIRFDGLWWRRLAYVGSVYGPEWWKRHSPPAIAAVLFATVGPNRRGAVANMQRILAGPERAAARRAALAMFVQFAHCMTETMECYGPRPKPIRIDLPKEDALAQALADGDGAVVVTGHFGNWDIAAKALREYGRPINLVMAREVNATTHEFVRAARERAGVRVIYSDSSVFSSLNMIRALRRNEVVAIQLDRPVGAGNTRAVPFFGAPAAFPTGPFVLARVSGAPLVPVFAPRLGTRHYAIRVCGRFALLRDARDARALDRVMEDVVQAFERVVRKFPTQWFQFAPFWPATTVAAAATPVRDARASARAPVSAVAECDVVVIGGGPAGSTAAGFLAQSGARVVLLEKARFPRYHIGESLLSATLPILEALGVSDAIAAAGFVHKPGGTFIWGARDEPWSFFFREDPGGRPHAYHVVRAEFDHILLRHAAALGVDVREGHQVHSVDYDGVTTVNATDDRGSRTHLAATYVIDASGQQALLGQRDGLRQFDAFFKNLAVFGYFAGAEPLSGPVAGNILSATFADGWVWFIPLHDGTTSVGAVIDAHRFASAAAGDPGALYRRLLAACPPVATRLQTARLVSPVRVIRDYSYCSHRFYGPGYLLAGDAACFIDPVFSTGVHLACLAGYLAAQAIASILQGAAPEGALREYDSRYRAAFERYLNFLYFFYDHHSDADSYFWRARKVLGTESGIDARTAFVRLLSGAGDLLDGDAALAEDLATRHARMSAATQRGRFAAVPGAELFRVRGTLGEMEKRTHEKKYRATD